MDVPLEEVGVEVDRVMPATREAVWDVLTDLSLTRVLNRETQETVWVEPFDRPSVGAVFRATNQLGDWRWTLDCHVTRCDRPVAFEWTVLEPAHPSSRWWYRLEPDGTGTLVRHGFRHGPNTSGLRRRIEDDPANAAAIVEARTAMLRDNMRFTLDRIAELSVGRDDP